MVDGAPVVAIAIGSQLEALARLQRERVRAQASRAAPSDPGRSASAASGFPVASSASRISSTMRA